MSTIKQKNQVKETMIHQTENILDEYKNNDKIISYFDEQVEFEKAKIYMQSSIEDL